MQPKVSIITICFNQARYINDAMDSVLSQGYENLEYLVLDPGSTDGSREAILAKATSPRLRYIFEKDGGPADGLNRGFAAASGDIFGFVNADDVLCPDAVAEAVDYLASGKLDVISGHGYVIDCHGRVLRRAYSDRYSLRAVAYKGCFLVQQATFFTRAIFERAGGFNVNNCCTWDGELWIAMAEAGARFGIADRFWGKYRIHDASITGAGHLDSLLQQYSGRIFKRIVGREQSGTDRIVREYYRLRRYMLNWRDPVQRIAYGPIYRRYAR